MFESKRRHKAERVTDVRKKGFLLPNLSAYIPMNIANITDIKSEEEYVRL